MILSAEGVPCELVSFIALILCSLYIVCFLLISKQSWSIPFSEWAFRWILHICDFYYDELTFVDCPRRYTLNVTHPDKLDPCFFHGWAERRFRDFYRTYIKTTAAAGESPTPIVLSLFVDRDMNYNEEGEVEYEQVLFKLHATYFIAGYQEETEETRS
jgi:hypothetical protein